MKMLTDEEKRNLPLFTDKKKNEGPPHYLEFKHLYFLAV
jgi:hypothetical protein